MSGDFGRCEFTVMKSFQLGLPKRHDGSQFRGLRPSGEQTAKELSYQHMAQWVGLPQIDRFQKFAFRLFIIAGLICLNSGLDISIGERLIGKEPVV